MNINEIISTFEQKDHFAPYDIYRELIKVDESFRNDSEFGDIYSLEIFTYMWYRYSTDDVSPFWDYLQSDTDAALTYWQKRMDTVENPLLRVRYAAIIWDFARFKKIPTDKKFAETAIDCIIKIAESNMMKDSFDSIDMLKWALNNAISIKNDDILDKIYKVSISFENNIAKDNYPGLWGFSYEMFCIDKRLRKYFSSYNINDDIIGPIRNRFERLCNYEPSDLSKNNLSITRSVEILADFYQKNGQNEDKINVLSMYSTAIKKANFESSLVRSHHLQDAFGMLQLYGANDLLKDIGKELNETNSKATSEYKEILHEVPINFEEVENVIKPFLEGNLSDALKLFTSRYFILKEFSQQRLNQYTDRFILYKLMPIAIRDHKGRHTATIGTYPEDNEGQLIYHIHQEIFNNITSFFRNKIITRIINHFQVKSTDITDYLFQSPVFESSRYEIINTGVKEYLIGSFITSIHVLIPQIEEACRHLLELLGGNIYKRIRNGGIQLKTFDDVLNDSAILHSLNDIALYLRVLYTDPRGMNLRNNICHGFYPPEIMNFAVAELVLHSLLCISLIRKEDKQ